ncbi:hypothetical protein V6N13_051526 [Hibiscus sabdariffa]|uniref:Profilin n=1 Tax=Hibiscus sabdariffa TaxID=183260 RepID=A0ABR2T4E0_9ROSI
MVSFLEFKVDFGFSMEDLETVLSERAVEQSVLPKNFDGLKGPGGITIKKTGQALVLGIYEEPVTPGQCNIAVERLGGYLAEQGL